jgi:deoxyxylulose-5-phosphate synthase
LRFIEQNCVQCGLCATTCPEDAIALQPRLLLTPERSQLRVLNEAKPWACVRCSKPFGTVKAIEAMLGKLSGHAMFQGEALERLKMCSDCRVIDLYSLQPIDSRSLLRCARETKRIITVEDHYAAGGIGDAVATCVASSGFTVERLCVREIPRSGTPEQLVDHYGISSRHIVAAVTT